MNAYILRAVSKFLVAVMVSLFIAGCAIPVRIVSYQPICGCDTTRVLRVYVVNQNEFPFNDSSKVVMAYVVNQKPQDRKYNPCNWVPNSKVIDRKWSDGLDGYIRINSFAGGDLYMFNRVDVSDGNVTYSKGQKLPEIIGIPFSVPEGYRVIAGDHQSVTVNWEACVRN
jgi:hypothetical protein